MLVHFEQWNYDSLTETLNIAYTINIEAIQYTIVIIVIYIVLTGFY